MNEWEMSRDSLRKFENLPLSSNLNISEENENFYLKSLSPGNKLFLFAYNLILILFYIIFSYQRPNPYKGSAGVDGREFTECMCHQRNRSVFYSHLSGTDLTSAKQGQR